MNQHRGRKVNTAFKINIEEVCLSEAAATRDLGHTVYNNREKSVPAHHSGGGVGLPTFLGRILADKILNRKRNKRGADTNIGFPSTNSQLPAGCGGRAAAARRNETLPGGFLQLRVPLQPGQSCRWGLHKQPGLQLQVCKSVLLCLDFSPLFWGG